MSSTQIQHLGMGNGMPEGCVGSVSLDDDERIGTGNITLEQLMKVAWFVKKMSWGNNTGIDLGSVFTYQDPDEGYGSLSYPEVKPEDRICGIDTPINNYLVDQGLYYRQYDWTYSLDIDYDDSDADVIGYEIVFNGNGSSIIDDDANGERKFFHGIKFIWFADQYESSDYGGYRSTTVRYYSGPMVSSTEYASRNQNTTTDITEGENDEYVVGTGYVYRTFTESIVNIGGIPFVRSVRVVNYNVGNGYDSYQHALPPAPSLTFYDYPTS